MSRTRRTTWPCDRSEVGSRMAAFQLSTNGRLWVSTEELHAATGASVTFSAVSTSVGQMLRSAVGAPTQVC
jgi:hypothetical protein